MVLDPFGGTGTTAVAAEALERRWILTEIDPTYASVLPERIVKGR
jgi:DNA modification methylase